MAEVRVITLDSGLLGWALRFLNVSWRLFGYFLLLGLVSVSISYISFQWWTSDPSLAWAYSSPVEEIVLLVGAALLLLSTLSFAGLFLLPIANLRTNLYRINRTLRTKLRASQAWGPVTRATIFSATLALCIFLTGFALLVASNRRGELSMSALNSAVAGLTLLMAGAVLAPIDDSSAASIVIFSAPTGRWKGIFSVHTWIALNDAGPARFVRYDVVGWGQPVHVNDHAPDGKWYGNIPKVVARFDGREAEKLLPAFRSAITSYSYRQAGDYRLWPGPNSNTFIASLLVAVPQANVVMPSNAIGRDWRGSFYVGPSPSRTGAQVSLFGVLGVTLGWTDGIELNVLGLVVGLDVRRFVDAALDAVELETGKPRADVGVRLRDVL